MPDDDDGQHKHRKYIKTRKRLGKSEERIRTGKKEQTTTEQPFHPQMMMMVIDINNVHGDDHFDNCN